MKESRRVKVITVVVDHVLKTRAVARPKPGTENCHGHPGLGVSGGRLWTCAGAGTRDKYDQPQDLLDEALVAHDATGEVDEDQSQGRTAPEAQDVSTGRGLNNRSRRVPGPMWPRIPDEKIAFESKTCQKWRVRGSTAQPSWRFKTQMGNSR